MLRPCERRQLLRECLRGNCMRGSESLAMFCMSHVRSSVWGYLSCSNQVEPIKSPIKLFVHQNSRAEAKTQHLARGAALLPEWSGNGNKAAQQEVKDQASTSSCHPGVTLTAPAC